MFDCLAYNLFQWVIVITIGMKIVYTQNAKTLLNQTPIQNQRPVYYFSSQPQLKLHLNQPVKSTQPFHINIPSLYQQKTPKMSQQTVNNKKRLRYPDYNIHQKQTKINEN